MRKGFDPVTTIGPGEASLRVGLGSLLCGHIGKDLSPRERRQYHLLVDSSAELTIVTKDVEDINYWPVMITRVYKKLDAAIKESDILFTNEWLYRDTAVFHLRDNLPQEGVVETMANGNHVLQQVLLAFVFNNQTVWYDCGCPSDLTTDLKADDAREIFIDVEFGEVMTREMMEQYAAIAKCLPAFEELSFDQPVGADQQQLVMRKWMIAHALLVNRILTDAHMSA